MFSDYVYPICLPAYEWFENHSLEKGFMEVAGWGIDNIGSNKLFLFAYSNTCSVISYRFRLSNRRLRVPSLGGNTKIRSR